MDEMRADMGGAACGIASIYTAARLEVNMNIMGTASRYHLIVVHRPITYLKWYSCDNTDTMG